MTTRRTVWCIAILLTLLLGIVALFTLRPRTVTPLKNDDTPLLLPKWHSVDDELFENTLCTLCRSKMTIDELIVLLVAAEAEYYIRDLEPYVQIVVGRTQWMDVYYDTNTRKITMFIRGGEFY